MEKFNRYRRIGSLKLWESGDYLYMMLKCEVNPAKDTCVLVGWLASSAVEWCVSRIGTVPSPDYSYYYKV